MQAADAFCALESSNDKIFKKALHIKNALVRFRKTKDDYMLNLNLPFLFLIIFLNACGADNSEQVSASNTIVLGSTAFTQVDGTNISISNSATAGDGTLVALDPLGSLASGKNLKLEASLNSGGSISLSAYADNSGKNGLSFVFKNTDDTLKVTASGPDFSADLTSYFSDMSASELTYYIDVHNDETPAHIIIWGEDPNAPPIYNSEDDTPGFDANGSEVYVGVGLISASLKELTIANPKFEEE